MGSITTTTLSEKGQIVIPKEIREKANLKKGDKLIILLKNEKFLIEKLSSVEEHLSDEFDELLQASESSTDFWDNKEDQVWDNV